MPAKRRSRKKIKRSRTFRLPLKKIMIILLSLICFLLIASFYTYFSTSSLWGDNEKLSVVVDNGNEGVVVVLLDPIHEEIYKFYYPEDLEIEAARNLGKWKIGSLWELGKDEGVGGALLAHTITKSIKTPVYAWSNDELLMLLDRNFLAIPKIMFNFNSDTNLSIKDFVKIFRFSSKVENAKLITYTPDQLNYISKAKLKDGTDGYVVTRDPETKIMTLFADEYILADSSRAIIISSSNNQLKVKQIGEVFEAIGVKIAAIRGETHEVEDCEISAKDIKLAENLSKYLDCEFNAKTSTNFDIEIRIGEEFVKRF